MFHASWVMSRLVYQKGLVCPKPLVLVRLPHSLSASLLAYGQLPAPFTAAAAQHLAAVTGFHPRAEAVDLGPMALFGLVGSFGSHNII